MQTRISKLHSIRNSLRQCMHAQLAKPSPLTLSSIHASGSLHSPISLATLAHLPLSWTSRTEDEDHSLRISRGVEPTDHEGEYARSDDPQAEAITSSAWSACLLMPLMLMSALLTQTNCSATNSIVEESNLQRTKVNRRRPRTERRDHLVCNFACCCSRGSSSHARQCTSPSLSPGLILAAFSIFCSSKKRF